MTLPAGAPAGPPFTAPQTARTVALSALGWVGLAAGGYLAAGHWWGWIIVFYAYVAAVAGWVMSRRVSG